MRTWLIIGLVTLAVGDPINKQENRLQKHQHERKQPQAPSSVSPAVSAPPGQPTPGPKQDSTQSDLSPSFCKWFFDPLVANWPLVAIAIPGIWIALRTLRNIQQQTKATETAANAAARTAEMADQTLHLTQPADLFVEGVNLVPKGPLTLHTLIYMVVQNRGQTRAEKFTNDLTLGIQGRRLGPVEPRSDIGVILGAGQPFNIGFGPLRNTLTMDELARVLSGTALLKIWGSLKYQDVFGKRYVIECEGTYNPSENNFFIDRFEQRYDTESDSKAN